MESSTSRQTGSWITGSILDNAGRSWAVAAPAFLDETQDGSDLAPGDLPIRAVGGALKLYSGRPPCDEQLPLDIDRALLADTEATVEAMTRFAKDTSHEISFELDGGEVGWIENGEPDSLLTEGLLDPWRQSLAR